MIPTLTMPAAIHMPGGNRFDNLMLDIDASIRAQSGALEQVGKQTVRRSWVRNWMRRYSYLMSIRLGIHEALVSTGIDNRWFLEFRDYWSNSCGGRPINVVDFHQLHFHYRVRSQVTQQLGWSDNQAHVANWQLPCNLSSVFMSLYRSALNPIRSHELPGLLRNGMRVLEYGCSIAPMYRTWREFYSHIDVTWTLADIPNHPFHYARHAYGRDREAAFALITPELFDDPLREVAGDYDVIIIQEVFEHLHKPRHMAEYLLNRLAEGGLLVFDYAVSDAKGLDTPSGLSERSETLEYLRRNLEFTWGELTPERATALCVGRKRRGDL